MTSKELNDALKARIEKDYKNYETNLMNSSKEFIRNHSYETALIDQLHDSFMEYAFCDDYEINEEEVLPDIEKLLKFESNLLEEIFDTYLSFNHPERLDVWGEAEGWSGTFEVIELACEIISKNIK